MDEQIPKPPTPERISLVDPALDLSPDKAIVIGGAVLDKTPANISGIQLGPDGLNDEERLAAYPDIDAAVAGEAPYQPPAVPRRAQGR